MKKSATYSVTIYLIPIVLFGGITACSSRTPHHRVEPSVKVIPQTMNGSMPPAHTTSADHADLSPDASLADVITMAALRHPGMKAAFETWKAATAKRPQVTALPDPQFSYGYFIREVETRVGAQQQRLGISQKFPWFGKRSLAGQMADFEAESAWQVFESTKRSLFRDIKTTWNELAFLHESIRITKENIDLMKHLESLAQARFRSGSDVTGVVKAQVEIGKLEDRLISLQDRIHPLSARLNAHLNRPSDASLPIPDLNHEPASELPENSMSALLLQHPDLARLRAEVEKQASSIALARKNRNPDLTLGLDYIQTDSSPMAGITDNGKDPLMITAAFNIPVWEQKNKAHIRQAESNTSAAKLRLLQRENELKADLSMALFAFRDAGRKLALYRDSLTPLTQNGLRVAEQSYQAGQADFLEIIDAQRLLLEFQLSYQRALADRAIALADLEQLLGTTTMWPGSNTHFNTNEP